jgi:thiol-disulfide isomerase/thioredoxin
MMPRISRATFCLVFFGICSVSLLAQSPRDDGMIETRTEELNDLLKKEPVDWQAYREGAQALTKAYPTRAEAYLPMTRLIWQEELDGHQDRELALADDLAAAAAPASVSAWAKAVVFRLKALDRPISISFEAVDGHQVEVGAMKGKVVLVDFWATWCPPCVAAIPKIKALYSKYHPEGLEVIGISCDISRTALTKFVAKRQLPWPQYCDGAGQMNNPWCKTFGIDGLPFVMLLDKSGCLRFASAHVDEVELEARVRALLAK